MAKKQTRRTVSKGELAAIAVATERISLNQAAARFGITIQAVHAWYRRKFGDAPTPDQERWAANRAALSGALSSGATLDEMQDATGINRELIRREARKLGIALTTRREIRLEAALLDVADGKTYAQAAVINGLDETSVSDFCRSAGIHSKIRGGRNGLATSAADLVEVTRCSVSDAARQMKCSVAAVSQVLKRRRNKRAAA